MSVYERLQPIRRCDMWHKYRAILRGETGLSDLGLDHVTDRLVAQLIASGWRQPRPPRLSPARRDYREEQMMLEDGHYRAIEEIELNEKYGDAF